jgi:glycosyltransferase involved in cell wall biosynthesis
LGGKVLVPVLNTMKVVTGIAGTDIRIPPGQWVEVPLADALRYKRDSGLVIAWNVLADRAVDWQDGVRHISIISPFNPFDGYGLVGLHAVTGLEERGFRLHISNNGFRLHRDVIAKQYPKVDEVLRRDTEVTRWGLCHIQPKEFDRVTASKRIAWTMWEATRLPKNWVEYFGLVERLIVPTKGQVEIFRKSGIDCPIDVIPDGIDFDAFTYLDRPERETFTFISWGYLSQRKCPWQVVDCFKKAFPANKYPNLRLVFKTRDKLFGARLGVIPTFDDERISVISEHWDLSRLVQFCHEADAAIFLSHGEGFGQPAVQAMATGLPVILSNHSGQSDFARWKYNYPVDLNPHTPYVHSPLGAEYGEPDSLEWWENDYDQVVELMREVYHNQRDAKVKGKRASGWVRKNFSISMMVDKLATLLKGLD